MAKKRSRKPNTEEIIYCSGPEWEGDGSKSTSACPFKDSKLTTAVEYKCGRCSVKLTPDKIYADSGGITEAGRRTPLPEPSKGHKKRRIRRPPF